MRSLWRDVREHKVAAVLLLVGWIALMAVHSYAEVLWWASSGRHPPFVIALAGLLADAFPFVAAIVAGWWRAAALASPTALKSGSWLGPSILSGQLAALTSSVAYQLCFWGFYSAGAGAASP